MNPNTIKRLFPNASESLLRANEADYGSGRPSEQVIPAHRNPVETVLMPIAMPDSAQGVKFTITGIPMGKPRMTQRDKWAKRPCVMRYRAWCDEARKQLPDLPLDPVDLSWVAYLPIPKSWSEKKREKMEGTLHRQKPDRDNLDKGLLDFLFKQDCGIATGYMEKRWDDGKGPRVEVSIR